MENKPRKHLILYILDIPYFIIYVLLYQVMSFVMYVPLFLLLNLTQTLVFIEGNRKSLFQQLCNCFHNQYRYIVLALPRILLGTFQVSIWLLYLGIPLYCIEVNYHPIKSYVKEEDGFYILVNYGAIYTLLIILQFATLRRLSKKLFLGMALRNQQDQRGLFIKNILWLISIIFCIIAIPSGFGILRLQSGYSKKLQDYKQAKASKSNKSQSQNVSCRVFFDHSLKSMLLGYGDLFLKVAEIFIYVLVKMSYLIMFIFPWRKSNLETKLKEAKNIYQGAALIIIEGLQTIIDLPIIILFTPLVCILTPYRVKFLLNDFKSKDGSEWRGMLFSYFIKTFSDIPFILMGIVICITIVQIFRLKYNVDRRQKQDKQLELRYILKQEITYHFFEIFEFIIKLIVYILLNVILFISIILVVHRIRRNITFLNVYFKAMNKNFKGNHHICNSYLDMKNVFLIIEALKNNFVDLIGDVCLILVFILYLASVILTFWRYVYHKRFWTIEFPKFQIEIKTSKLLDALDKKQFDLIYMICGLIITNIIDIFYDLTVLILVMFNVFGFWRYSLLYNRYKSGQLTRSNLCLNPFYTLLDIPWLLLILLTTILCPWRLYSYYRLSKHHNHFQFEIYAVVGSKTSKTKQMNVINYQLILFCFSQGIIDYLYSPFIVIAVMFPQHIPIMLNLLKFDMQYENLTKLTENEFLRRAVIIFYCIKTLSDIFNYFILFPLSMLTLYFLPLFIHMRKHQKQYITAADPDKVKQIINKSLYTASVFFNVLNDIQDFYYPQDVRFIIREVNEQFKLTLPYFPLMIVTALLNPYRTYQFTCKDNHSFINFKVQNLNQLKIDENNKRHNSFEKFKESLTDFLALVAFIVICITGFRVIYLIAVLSVNGHTTYFNKFLKRRSKSSLLILKLQQIERILEKEDQQDKLVSYLSLKYCIWISLLELLLDLAVSPFIIAYFIFIPWRLDKLWTLAMTQYERVPTKKQNKKHYMREVNQGKSPKRVEAIKVLFVNFAIDYSTIAMTVVLILTLWRSINAIEILIKFYKKKFSKDAQVRQYLETFVKDKTLNRFIFTEFKYLMTDLLFLILFVLVMIMWFQAKQLWRRVNVIFEKRKSRKEIKSLNLLAKIMTKPKVEEKVLDTSKGKKITSLNKNIMSILLPYLKHDEILRVEGTCKLLYISSNYWPVWKNIFDYHKVDQKISEFDRTLTQDEQDKQDYRSACKRCYKFLRDNVEEDIMPDLLEYQKGYQIVIVEEFIISINLLPSVYLIPIGVIEKVFTYQRIGFQKVYEIVEPQLMNNPTIDRTCLVQTLFQIPQNTPFHQFEDQFQPSLKYSYTRLVIELLKIYIMTINFFKSFISKLFVFFIKLVSAGPVGNLRIIHAPPGHQYSSVIAIPLYCLQSLLYIPTLIAIVWPVLLFIGLLYFKFYVGFDWWILQYIYLLPLFGMLVEILRFNAEFFTEIRVCIPFIDPFYFIRLSIYAIKYVATAIGNKVHSTGKGILHYIEIVGNIVGSFIKSIYSTVLSYLYTIIKSILKVLNTVVRWIVQVILTPIKGANSIYFSIFKILLIQLKKLGILGELLFTIFGLIWLIWPLIGAYLIGRNELYIPGGVATIILIVQGRKIIKAN